MTSRERVFTALNHREPDHVPLDFGSTAVTGIHIDAYRRLRAFMGFEERETEILDLYQQTAVVHEDILQKLQVDTRGVLPNPPSGWRLQLAEEGEYICFVNEWGVKWRKPKENGRYFDPIGHPLAGSIERDIIDCYKWPDPVDEARFAGLAEKMHQLDKDVAPGFIVEGIGGELFDTLFWVRGAVDVYLDFGSDPSTACYLMDRFLEYQMRYWGTVVEKLGTGEIILRLGDDLGDQRGTRISPEMYRRYIKPRHRKLIQFIRQTSSKPVYVFLHSCGSVYDLVGDFIEIGVDILNPVQVSASKMESGRLKREFGRDIVFWGGGVDTQRVLPYGSTDDVKAEVKRRIDDLAPDGGFVFNPVHNIQFDVPPENIVALWEAWLEYGVY
jgi:uroporphyrinogen decarboxylase